MKIRAAFGLAKSEAREFLEKPQELAWSPAARPPHKLACWQKLVGADVDRAKHFLLTNIIETYVKLGERDQITFDRYLEDTKQRITRLDEADRLQDVGARLLDARSLDDLDL